MFSDQRYLIGIERAKMDKGFLKWLWENNKKTAGVFSAMWAIYTFFTSCKSYFESKDIALTAQVTISWAAALQAVVIFVGMIIIHKSQLRYDSGDHPGKHNYLKFYLPNLSMKLKPLV